jgi:hypothetical protein
MQQKSVTREMKMQQSSIKLLHQSSLRQSFRESSIARNFLRQSSLSSSQSKQNSYSRQSHLSENLYSDSSSENLSRQSHLSENLYSDSSSENFYIRSEKKSMFRQSFQLRFSKFYQSSKLSEQFYRRSTGYSLFVSSRLLSHEYSSSISSSSFASSSSFSSLNQSIKLSGTGYDRELINLTKLYSEKTKYSEENDNFSFKLTMFNDMCDRVDVLFEAKLKAFFTMLKELALGYYYANVISSKNAFTFDDVCISIMSYFEDAEYKKMSERYSRDTPLMI